MSAGPERVLLMGLLVPETCMARFLDQRENAFLPAVGPIYAGWCRDMTAKNENFRVAL